MTNKLEISPPALNASDVEWVVLRLRKLDPNNEDLSTRGNLGVKIGHQIFVLNGTVSKVYDLQTPDCDKYSFRKLRPDEFGDTINAAYAPYKDYGWRDLGAIDFKWPE